MKNEELEDYLERYLDRTLEKTNGIALELMVVSDNLKSLGLYGDKEKENIEQIRAKTIGVYEFCQDLCKKVNKFKKENKKDE